MTHKTMTIASTAVELALRKSSVCAGCGNEKTEGIVCWGPCWSGPKGLKYYPGTLGDWLYMMDTEQRRENQWAPLSLRTKRSTKS